MNHGPTAAELCTAVARWLEASAAGADGFHGRVAANALAIVARELDLGPAAHALAIARLTALTGRTGSFADLETALCEMIDRRDIPLTDPALHAHLRATARDRLAIDQPRYRSLLRLEPV